MLELGTWERSAQFNVRWVPWIWEISQPEEEEKALETRPRNMSEAHDLIVESLL